MSENIDINVVAENLVELLTNSTNLASVFYDIFLNPIPMDVTLQQYNDENKLIEITIPNRAKDRKIAITGEGSPEGVIEAPPGVCYVDSVASLIYFKVTGMGDTGWTAVPTEESLADIIARLRVTIATSGSNVVLLDTEGNITSSADISNISANKSLSNLSSAGNAVLAGKASVDLDNLTPTGISKLGLTNSRDNQKLNYWVGTKAQYDAIATKDSGTVYHTTEDSDVTSSILNVLYPVGSLYIASSTVNTCPLAILGIGTWTLKSVSTLVTGVNSIAPVVGNGYTLGLTNGTNIAGLFQTTDNGGSHIVPAAAIQPVGGSLTTDNLGNNKAYGLVTDPTKSGIQANITSTTLTVKVWERIR